MSDTAEDLVIIYEAEAEQWATYLRSILAGPVAEAGICCYDVAMVASRRDDFLRLGRYKCKLLILSRGMLEGLCQLRRFFLARVLQPAAHVVVLLCGVDSLEPLLDVVPLKGEECLQISSEQDAQEYTSAVAEIVRRGAQTAAVDVSSIPGRAALELKLEKRHSSGALSAKPSLQVIPSRVSCENPGEVFILLREAVACKDAEVEFSGNKQRVRVKPVSWNEQTLSVNAADLPAGSVSITLYCGGVARGKARLQYYSTMGEINRLLTQAADPLHFMCQAFQVCSVEKLDQTLTASLMKRMPTGGFQGLQCDQSPDGVAHSEDIPTLLHFAAQHGLRDVTSVLLQCPGAQQALRTTNQHGETPLELAQRHGHAQLHILLQETLIMCSGGEDGEDTSVYEMMGTAGNLVAADSRGEGQSGANEGDEEEEDPYAPLGVNDEEYDTILTSSNAVVIANRPPAPTPRPETLPTKEDSTPFIAQVFQKKMLQGDAETLYSLPTKQARGRDSISSTYDTFVPSQPPGLEELIELQEKVKRGSLSMDEALERFSDWQRVQRGLDAIQQEKLRQLRASIINNREDDESVYDKINIIHHTPNVTVNECRRGSQPVETDFYSKPLKGQQSNLFWKADKR